MRPFPEEFSLTKLEAVYSSYSAFWGERVEQIDHIILIARGLIFAAYLWACEEDEEYGWGPTAVLFQVVQSVFSFKIIRQCYAYCCVVDCGSGTIPVSFSTWQWKFSFLLAQLGPHKYLPLWTSWAMIMSSSSVRRPYKFASALASRNLKQRN